jgi:hypothetical protein
LKQYKNSLYLFRGSEQILLSFFATERVWQKFFKGGWQIFSIRLNQVNWKIFGTEFRNELAIVKAKLAQMATRISVHLTPYPPANATRRNSGILVS